MAGYVSVTDLHKQKIRSDQMSQCLQTRYLVHSMRRVNGDQLSNLIQSIPPPKHLFEVNFNIVLLSTPRSLKLSLPFGFSVWYIQH